MLFQESILNIADNTGPKKAKCLKLINNHGNRKMCYLGEEIIVAIQKKRVKFKKKTLDKKIFNGLIITTKHKTKRLDGNFVKFSTNNVVLLNSDLQFLGTRVYGLISKEIRDTKIKELKYKRIISYSCITI